MNKFNTTYFETKIDPSEVEAARNAGLRIHHNVHIEEYGYSKDNGVVEWVDEVLCDDWYAAHPDWVKRYHNDGGSWEYND